MRFLRAIHDRAQSRLSGLEPEVRLHALRTPQFTVDLDASGRILNVLTHPKPEKGAQPYRTRTPVPAVARSLGVAPLLLSDNAQYVLGLEREGSKRPGDGARKGAAYAALLERAAAELGAPLAAVCRALPELSIPAALPADLIAFQVDGANPHDDPRVQAWWIHQALAQGEQILGTCSVSGAVGPLARNTPKLGGIPGGQAKLVALSLNGNAFVWRGQTHLGVSQALAETVSSEIERLARDPRHSYKPSRKSSFVIVHWLEGGEVDPFQSLVQPQAEAALVQAALGGIDSGEVPLTPAQGTRMERVPSTLHLAVLTGSGARLSVRGYQSGPVSQVLGHLGTYFSRLAVVNYAGEPHPTLPGLWGLLASSTPDGTLDLLPGGSVVAMVRHALFGTRVPQGLQSGALARWKAEGKLPPARAALLRLTLCAQEIPMTEALEPHPDLPSPLKEAHALGRYLAIADAVHRRASPGVGRTLLDQYRSALTQAPARTFARLAHQVDVHLRTLERGRSPAYRPLRDALEDAVSGVVTLPQILPAEAQAVFALALHQQSAELTRQMRAAVARKALSRTPETSP